MQIGLADLQLDQRLRGHTPAEYEELWDVFKPSGRVDANVHLVRVQAGEPLAMSATVDCRDVAAVYRHFKYPLDHLTGRLTLEKNILAVKLQTLKGGQPVHLEGTIKNPGVDAVVQLDIQAGSIVIDDVLKNAMPPDVRKVVDQFNPSGVVKAHARVFRQPVPGRRDHPEGLIKIDAEIDMTERCEITWERLRYPIRNLKGRLEIHPNNWVFKNMVGENGQAKIKASGSVLKLGTAKLPNGEDPLKIDVYLEAQNLPFSAELKDALPPAWKRSWPIDQSVGSQRRQGPGPRLAAPPGPHAYRDRAAPRVQRASGGDPEPSARVRPRRHDRVAHGRSPRPVRFRRRQSHHERREFQVSRGTGEICRAARSFWKRAVGSSST